MREYPKKIKLTKSEDERHIRALVLAISQLSQVPNDYQSGVLRSVKQFLIDTNGELTPNLFKLFHTVLTQLEIDPPETSGGGPSGGWFTIPSKAGQARLEKRRLFRLSAWREALADASLVEADVNILLTDQIEQTMGIVAEINQMDSERDQLRQEVALLRAENERLRRGPAVPEIAIGFGTAQSAHIIVPKRNCIG